MEQILTMSAKIVGGIGVILLGMVLMTDSLKSLGGDTMKRVLYRLTKNSFVSVLSGAGFTALIHNSSAVILATVGFVGAGLLGFSNAIGVIFGANLGTTSTAWVVALVGFKLNIGIIILPLVAIGAFMKLFMKGSRASAGLAIAGFALLFVGIDVLNEGMRHLPHHITLSSFTLNNVFDEALLVGVGVVMTIALQSSTVAIVTTITAVNAGAITLEQATRLIIGQNIGKLYYGVIASIGVSVSAKRLAVVHIMFNVLTGLVIFALHSHFTRTVVAMCDIAGVTNPAIILSAFHTSLISSASCCFFLS
jgi:phosphate:Na+ symporter